MFRNIFNPDNALMITFAQISDCIFLSLLWVLGCFPIITFGAASAALYDSVFRAFRKGDKHSWGRFLSVLKKNFKAGLIPGLLFLVLFWLLLKGLVSIWNMAAAGALSWPLFSAGALLGVLALGILGLIFPVLSRFENSLFALLKNTLLLALANLPRTLMLGMLYALSLILCFRFVFPLFFLPALMSLISTVLIEPMFRPFMPPEEEDAE